MILFTSDNLVSSLSIKIFDINGKLVLKSNSVSKILLIKDSGIYFVNSKVLEGVFKQRIYVK